MTQGDTTPTDGGMAGPPADKQTTSTPNPSPASPVAPTKPAKGMKHHTVQAMVEMGHGVHRFCVRVITVVLVITAAAACLAWRLSRGPLDLAFLKPAIEAAADEALESATLTIGGVALAWDGFSKGLDQPLVLRLTDVAYAGLDGKSSVKLPIAEAALSMRGLLLGRLQPRAITLRGARLGLTRAPDGSVSFDLGGADSPAPGSGPSPLTGLLGMLGQPAGSDQTAAGHRLSQLSAVAIHGAEVVFDDRRMGQVFRAPHADIDLARQKGGGLDGRASARLNLGDQTAVLNATFVLAAAAKSAHAVIRLSPVTPKGLSGLLPALAAIDAPVTLDAEADFGPDFQPTKIHLTARAGAGKANTASGAIPFRRAEFVATGTADEGRLDSAVIELQAKPGGTISTARAAGQFIRRNGRIAAAVNLTLDQVGFSDMAALWPADIGPYPRKWITENILTGRAHDGRAELHLEGPQDLSDVALTRATATLEGDDLTVTWLPRVPPVEQGRAHLVLTDPDKIEIDIKTARQKVNGADPIAIHDGHVTLTGLSKKDQVATVKCEVEGSLVSAIALLKEPRLRLLDRHPMSLQDPAGAARLTFSAVIPLELNLDIDDVTLRAAGKLTGVHLGGIAAGKDLDDGAVAIDVDTTHLALNGTARLAGIAIGLDGAMDFRTGPPTQVTQRFTVTGKPTAKALADAGIDTAGVLDGAIGLRAALSQYRNGDGEIAIDADLTPSLLTASPLGWRKPEGGAAKGSARVLLVKGNLAGIDRIDMSGPGLLLRGAVTAAGGRVDGVRIERALVGRTDVSGTIRLPPKGPIGVELSGPALDMVAKVTEKTVPRDRSKPAPPGQAWSLRGRFDRVFLAHDAIAAAVAVAADNDGTIFRALSLTGSTAPGEAFSVEIAQDGGGRRAAVVAANAGRLLSALDVTTAVTGGGLTVDGRFDDTTPDHRLTGTAEMVTFRVARVTALGKLLQAATLYGLVDALGGPGLAFSKLTAPFQLDDTGLVLRDARAFSPSLGVTVKGRIDLASDRLDLEGTVVPAYLFNSMLGNIPLLGRLFSAEKGGGLIAINYSLHGTTGDPAVLVNPFSALTPGILRGMFGIFDPPPLDRAAADGKPPGP